MSSVDSLLSEIDSRLSAHSLSYTSASAGNDVYEGFVFSLAVSTALDCGASVQYRDVSGNRPSDLVFRTGPGHLHSTNRPYTHAVVELGSAPALEIHVGVYVQGTSGVQHECDVVLLRADEADDCRSFGILPRSSNCVCAIECKYYTSGIPLGQARGFIGLKADFGNTPTMFVANTTSPSSARYLNRRATEWEDRIVPANREIDHLCSSIRKALREYAIKFDSSVRL